MYPVTEYFKTSLHQRRCWPVACSAFHSLKLSIVCVGMRPIATGWATGISRRLLRRWKRGGPGGFASAWRHRL